MGELAGWFGRTQPSRSLSTRTKNVSKTTESFERLGLFYGEFVSMFEFVTSVRVNICSFMGQVFLVSASMIVEGRKEQAFSQISKCIPNGK